MINLATQRNVVLSRDGNQVVGHLKIEQSTPSFPFKGLIRTARRNAINATRPFVMKPLQALAGGRAERTT